VSALLSVASFVAAVIWAGILIWPARPWGCRQRIDADHSQADTEQNSFTAIIPARNEASTIERCLHSVLQQGKHLNAMVVDDDSGDDTARRITALDSERVRLLRGQPLPQGWTGKLWALQQATEAVKSRYLLLLDADIKLAPGVLAALYRKMHTEQLGLISIMAELQVVTFWERLLMPAYVYFFKMLYPFALVNCANSRVAAAAGGCVLLRAEALRDIGGFVSLRNALIDDCTLAAKIKQAGWPIHIALSHDVTSLRRYSRLAEVWQLVARTASSQLHHSVLLLIACTLAMLVLFIVPLLALFSPQIYARWSAVVALVALLMSGMPMLRFYRLHPLRAVLLPPIAVTFLLMTWNSVWRHWRGGGARWKDRSYSNNVDNDDGEELTI